MKLQSEKAPVDSTVPAEKNEFIIQDAASWVLRVGVFASIAVMAIGLGLSWIHGLPSIAMMQHISFQDNLRTMFNGLTQFDGRSVLDCGIYLLVLTPILRVAVSLILFIIADKDWFYAGVTFVVLALTLTSLILLKHAWRPK